MSVVWRVAWRLAFCDRCGSVGQQAINRLDEVLAPGQIRWPAGAERRRRRICQTVAGTVCAGDVYGAGRG